VTGWEMSKGPSVPFAGLPEAGAIFSLEYVIATSTWVTGTSRDSPGRHDNSRAANLIDSE